MPIGISKVGNVVKKIATNEVNILKDSKRAREIAKSLYPDKTLAGTRVMARKLIKEVGPEPVAGMLLGMYTNPIPGLSVVGYILGRGIAESRKALTQVIKHMGK